MSKINKQHDPLTRKFLTDVSVAREFLAIYLAPEIRAKCDFNSLKIESGSYIEDDLSIHCSDIVYQLDLINNNGSAYIYTLIEHQSSAIKLMPLRILKYQLAIIQKHLDNNKSDKLPLVIPLVFYNGKKTPYPYPINIAELFADQEIYHNYPLGKFKLIDLTVIDDSEILKHGKLAILEVLVKHIHHRDFMQIIELVIKALRIGHESGINGGLVDGAFSYLINAREDEEVKELVSRIKQEVAYYEENVMTYADTLRREGRQQGHQEGKKEAEIEIIRRLFEVNADETLIIKVTGKTKEEIKILRAML